MANMKYESKYESFKYIQYITSDIVLVGIWQESKVRSDVVLSNSNSYIAKWRYRWISTNRQKDYLNI